MNWIHFFTLLFWYITVIDSNFVRLPSMHYYLDDEDYYAEIRNRSSNLHKIKKSGRYVIFGSLTGSSLLLHKEYIYTKPDLERPTYVLVSFPPKNANYTVTIHAVRCIDKSSKQDNWEGTVSLVAGGVMKNFISVQIITPAQKGVNYTVDVFGIILSGYVSGDGDLNKEGSKSLAVYKVKK